jgi:hypothetical protein
MDGMPPMETYQCTDPIQTPFEYLCFLGMEEKLARRHVSHFEAKETGTLENYLLNLVSTTENGLELMGFPKETTKRWRKVLEIHEFDDDENVLQQLLELVPYLTMNPIRPFRRGGGQKTSGRHTNSQEWQKQKSLCKSFGPPK